MKWTNWVDAVFPYIEPLTADEEKAQKASLDRDITAINSAKFSIEPERALDEAQRVAEAETERVRTAESKATTYLAVLAALVPLVITLQAATWEDKSGPAPEGLKLGTMFLATMYVAGAGYHAFKTLQVSGFQRVVEGEIAAAWRTPRPLTNLTRSTLLASRRSRDAVNAKVTRIKVTHQHLVRAFGAFVLLLSLDPICYAFNSVGVGALTRTSANPERASELRQSGPQAIEASRAPETKPSDSGQASDPEIEGQRLTRPETIKAESEVRD